MSRRNYDNEKENEKGYFYGLNESRHRTNKGKGSQITKNY